jgi:hypothetical protein
MTQTKKQFTIKHQSYTKSLSQSLLRDGCQNGNLKNKMVLNFYFLFFSNLQ